MKTDRKYTVAAYYKRRSHLKVPREKIRGVDYKDVDFLKEFVAETGKIIPGWVTGIKGQDQRRLSRAIKYARYLALLPYSDKH